MQVLLFKIIIQVILMLILAPKPENTSPPQAKVSDYNLPTASEDRNQMLLYGTRKIGGSNNIFADDVSQRDIKESVGFIIKSDVTVATKYFIGFANGIAFGGETELVKITVNNDDLWVAGVDQTVYDDQDRTRGYVDKPEFHGTSGDVSNGISGYFNFYKGSTTQMPDSYINKFYSVPGWRGLCYISFESFYIGNTPTMPQFEFWCKRIPTIGIPSIDAIADIDGDCNPVVAIYDILTNDEYGIGISPSIIDIPSFEAAAQTLYDEGIGISLTYEDQYECDQFVSEILKVASGNLVEDYLTGQFKLKLTRDNYDPEEIFEFNTSNVINVLSYARNSQERLYSDVRLNFSDREKNYNTTPAPFFNDALLTEKSSGNDSFKIDYPWVTKADLASRLVSREAIPATRYMSSMELEVARITGLEVGDPVVVVFEPYGIQKAFYRITEIDHGTFRNNTMKVKLLQDTFGIELNVFAPPQPPGWDGIDLSAKPATLNFIETPYFFIQRKGYFLMSYGERPDGVTNKYDLYAKTSGSDFLLNGKNAAFTPIGTLKYELTEGDSIMKLAGDLEDLQNLAPEKFKEGYNMAIIDDGNQQEFVIFSNVSYDVGLEEYTLTGVERGLIDTFPKKFAPGTTVSFISYGYLINDNFEYGSNDLVDMKARTISSANILPLDEAPTQQFQIGIDSRSSMPNTPVNLKVNYDNFWDVNIGQENMILMWTVRTLEENQEVIRYDESKGNPLFDRPDEIVIKIYDNNDNLIKTVNEPVGSDLNMSYEFTDETTLNGGEYFPSLRIEMHSVKDNIESYDEYNFTITRV